MKKNTYLLSFLILCMIHTSCNDETVRRENPLLVKWDTPYGVPPFDKIEIGDYIPAFEEAMEIHNDEIETIIKNREEPTWENTILALDNAGLLLNTISNAFFLVSAADTNPEMQKVEAKISPELSVHSDNILLDDKLFERVKQVYDERSELGLDAMQMRLLEKSYKRFVRSGANLSKADKKSLMAINKELAVVKIKFSNNLLADNASFVMELGKDDLAGLPSGVKDMAFMEAKNRDLKDKWVFTISKPSMLPFLTYSSNRDLREKLYKGYLDKCNYDNETDNKEAVNDIVRLRTEKAHLLGFDTHAEFVLDDVMAKTPENVYALLDELWTPALEAAKKELEEMKRIKKRETGSDEFASWDWWYYAEKVRKQKYNLDENVLRPYFSLDNVRRGVFELSNRLFGITFSPVKTPVYNEECSVFQVNDVDGTLLGVVLFDFHPRAGKSPGAWCGTYISQRMESGERITPVVTIVCNFTRPTGNKPALLSLDEVETFFHEFGHALHCLFAQVPYIGLSDVERDFVELPSQIMENWAFEPEMLLSYAVHHQTGSVIPKHYVERIQRAATFNQGFATTELLAGSLSDMDIYNVKEYKPLNVNQFEIDALNVKRGLIPEIAPRYRYPYFSHIFDGGYSSGYYSYIWAEVLDKDAYQAFVESGSLFDRKTATKFRKLLESGGMADGMDLYYEFRGAEPSRKPLMEARGFITPE